jgi:hypothetical protein
MNCFTRKEAERRTFALSIYSSALANSNSDMWHLITPRLAVKAAEQLQKYLEETSTEKLDEESETKHTGTSTSGQGPDGQSNC